MAKQRYINTKLWSDDWVSNLDPVEKLLFIYLLTNERTNICGVYELPLKYMSVETGIEKDMVEKIIKRFEKDGKVIYNNGWAIIANFIEHQAINPKIEKGIAYLLQNEIPEEIKLKLYEVNPNALYYEEIYLPEGRKKNIRKMIKENDTCNVCKRDFKKEDLVVHHKTPRHAGGTNDVKNLEILCVDCHKDTHQDIGYDSLSKPLNYSNSNLNSNSNSNAETASFGNKAKYNPLGAEIIKSFTEIDPKNKNYYSNKTQRSACDFLIEEYGLEEVLKRISILPQLNKLPYFPSIHTPYELKEKWKKLEEAVEREQLKINSKKRDVVF